MLLLSRWATVGRILFLGCVALAGGCSSEKIDTSAATSAAGGSTFTVNAVGAKTTTEATKPTPPSSSSTPIAQTPAAKIAAEPIAPPVAKPIPSPSAPPTPGPLLIAPVAPPTTRNFAEPVATTPPSTKPAEIVAATPIVAQAARALLHPPTDYAAAAATAVERNGPIFHDWPAPKYSLVFTGDLSGYIEPCGCSGLENLKGGLSRRQTLLTQLAKQGWSPVPIDLGGQVRRVGVTQTEVKFQQTVKGLIDMGYVAIGFGADDLRMPAAALLGAATEPYHDKTAAFTSANVALFAFDSGATTRYRTTTVAGKKIGVTSVLADSFRQAISNDGVVTMPAEEALVEVVPQLVAEGCNQLVLLCYGTPAETEALVKKFPQFTLAVTAVGADEPPGDLRAVPGTRTGLIEVGKKGQHAIVLGFYDDPQKPVRYQRVPLDARFAESPAMKTLLVEYQDQLRIAGRENLGIHEKIHPRFDAAKQDIAKFVGSASCAKCHEGAYDVWKDSGHAHATETLERLDPPRQFDAECLSCHVTGWDPQQYVPFQTGFLDLLKTPQLTGNGCENCHGPGGGHVAAETGTDPQFRETMRKLMHVSKQNVEQTTCIKCHDHDNSPSFKFDEYWSQIEH
ncbi:MAG: multiheme c-type cytochrome [Pirellulales bacterium]